MPSTISAGTTAGTAIAIAGDTTGNLAFQTNGTTTAMTIDTSQNVGIGTASPTQKLTVSGYGFFSGANRGVILGENNCLIVGDSATLNASNMVFYTANTERMRIDSSGRVTMPFQPGFFIGFFQPTSVGGLNYMRINSPNTFWSVGSGLNFTGGPSGSTRYTAPVTGYYLLQWALMGSGSTGRLIGFVERNGAVVTEANSDSVNYANANTQFVINLSAGDYLDFRTSGSYFTSANGGHNMTIRLLG